MQYVASDPCKFSGPDQEFVSETALPFFFPPYGLHIESYISNKLEY